MKEVLYHFRYCRERTEILSSEKESLKRSAGNLKADINTRAAVAKCFASN